MRPFTLLSVRTTRRALYTKPCPRPLVCNLTIVGFVVLPVLRNHGLSDGAGYMAMCVTSASPVFVPSRRKNSMLLTIGLAGQDLAQYLSWNEDETQERHLTLSPRHHSTSAGTRHHSAHQGLTGSRTGRSTRLR